MQIIQSPVGNLKGLEFYSVEKRKSLDFEYRKDMIALEF